MRKVALCFILRNEAFMLDSVLTGLASKFPLVVANDFGSTDGTPEILDAHKVDWKPAAWPNSYAEARNGVMARAFELGADACFFLDGDEMIWPDTVETILNLEVPLAMFPRVNLRPGGKYEDYSYPDYQPRYISKESGCRYKNALHEVIDTRNYIHPVNVKIFHYNHFKGAQYMWLKNHNYARMQEGLPFDWQTPVPTDTKLNVSGVPWDGDIPIETIYSQDWFSPNIPVIEKAIRGTQSDSNFKVLEIGSFEGRSARWFLKTFPGSTIQCVDTFEGGIEHKELGLKFNWVKQRFTFNLDSFLDRMSLFHGASREYFKTAQNEAFDVVYVDGAHDAFSVLYDATQGMLRLKSGGLMILDDYGWDRYEDPLKNPRIAIDAFLEINASKLEVLEKGYQVIVRRNEH